MTFHIQDWTGKVLFDDRRFPSFEEGWSYILEIDPAPPDNDPDAEHWYDDYYVERVA